MRTVNENKGSIKRIYDFRNINFECHNEDTNDISSFYTIGVQRQITFSGYSNEQGSLLVKELKEKFLK